MTVLLRAIVTATGKPVETSHITKKTRQEVLYRSGELAWVRSPLWLLVRVSLQLLFTRRGGGRPSPGSLYKAFMLVLLKQILDLAEDHSDSLRDDLLHAVRAKLSRRVYKHETLKKLAASSGSNDIDDAKGIEESLGSVSLPDKDDSLVEDISASLRKFYSTREEAWREIVKDRSVDVNTSALAALQPEQHLDLDLPDLSQKISRMVGRLASCEANRPNADLEMESEYPVMEASEPPSRLLEGSDKRR